MPNRTSLFPADSVASHQRLPLHNTSGNSFLPQGGPKPLSSHNGSTSLHHSKRLQSQYNHPQKILQRHYNGKRFSNRIPSSSANTNWKFLVGAEYSRLNRLLTNLGAKYEKGMLRKPGSEYQQLDGEDYHGGFAEGTNAHPLYGLSTQTDTVPPAHHGSERQLILNHNQNTETEEWKVHEEHDDAPLVSNSMELNSVQHEEHHVRRRGKRGRTTQSTNLVELDANNQPLPPMGLDFLPPSGEDMNGSFEGNENNESFDANSPASMQSSPPITQQPRKSKHRANRKRRKPAPSDDLLIDGPSIQQEQFPDARLDIKSESHTTGMIRSHDNEMDNPPVRTSVSGKKDRRKNQRKLRKKKNRESKGSGLVASPTNPNMSTTTTMPRLQPRRSKNRLPTIKPFTTTEAAFYDTVESLSSNTLHENLHDRLIEYNLDILPALENAKRKKLQIKSHNYTKFKPRTAKSFTPYRYYTNLNQALKHVEDDGSLQMMLKSLTV
mmetsp:Transcript_11474/g.43068  ORF Transcript_11474/g.43068 Transcript_11474/m.43068 type:complete len:494 (-) Transcript_11474:28-1509(-)